MKLVVIESPYAGDVERNLAYLRECLRDSLWRGEAPYASHGLYTQPGVLNDKEKEERYRGIVAGFAWGERAEARIVYTDLGITAGMEAGIGEAHRLGQPVIYRSIRKEEP